MENCDIIPCWVDYSTKDGKMKSFKTETLYLLNREVDVMTLVNRILENCPNIKEVINIRYQEFDG